MAHLHKKMKKGRPYYYIREMARVNGKPKVINQVYLGSVERILSMAAGQKNDLEKIQVQEFGALWLANLIEKGVGLVEIIDSVIPRARKNPGHPSGNISCMPHSTAWSTPAPNEPCLNGIKLPPFNTSGLLI